MAGYTKLFSSIVSSTVWCEDDKTFRVWIWMLASADTEGNVEGSIPALARITNYSIPEVEASIARLTAPDPYSRTKDHEGRRIEEIPGGWRILNFPRYREQTQGKEGSRAPYFRSYRRRAKEKAAAPDETTTEQGCCVQLENVARNTATATATATEKEKSSGEAPPDVPRGAGRPTAAAPGGAEKLKSLEKPGDLPGWLKQDLENLGVGALDQAALHRRLGTLPLRAAVVQIQRKGDIRRPAALLNTKGLDLATEGAGFLLSAMKAAESLAPPLSQDREWRALPASLREDPEIRTAWAVWRAAEAAVDRSRGGGGELEALDSASGARRQINGLLFCRGGLRPRSAPARAAPPGPRLVQPDSG